MLSCLSQPLPWCSNYVSFAKHHLSQQNPFSVPCVMLVIGLDPEIHLLTSIFLNLCKLKENWIPSAPTDNCFTRKISCHINGFLSHKGIVLGVKVLVPGHQGGSPEIKTSLLTCFLLKRFLLGSPSLSPSSALSCRALPVVVPLWFVAFSFPVFFAYC